LFYKLFYNARQCTDRVECSQNVLRTNATGDLVNLLAVKLYSVQQLSIDGSSELLLYNAWKCTDRVECSQNVLRTHATGDLVNVLAVKLYTVQQLLRNNIQSSRKYRLSNAARGIYKFQLSPSLRIIPSCSRKYRLPNTAREIYNSKLNLSSSCCSVT